MLQNGNVPDVEPKSKQSTVLTVRKVVANSGFHDRFFFLIDWKQKTKSNKQRNLPVHVMKKPAMNAEQNDVRISFRDHPVASVTYPLDKS